MTPNDETNKEGKEEILDERTLEGVDSHGEFDGPPLSIGSVVQGKYRLLDSLGEGGMGVVYKVEQVLLNQKMALKTLTGNEFSESSIKRFHAEAKLLAKLEHPGLVKVRDFGFIDNVKPFLVMDFVQGRTLSSVLKTSGVMPLEAAIKIFVELCFALGYAHSNNIVHRDVKPSNIMLTTPGLNSENEHVKVLDFGIAKLLHRGINETEQLTRTGEIFGSPLYMSPEQCMGRPVDHRSDIYSMGCVMYEVLTGAPPFSGETSIATIMKHQSEKPLTLKEASMGRTFPQEIEDLVASMLEKDPDKRIQSLLDVAQLLIGVQKGLSGGQILNKPVAIPEKTTLSKLNLYIGCTICALLIGVIVMLGLLYFNKRTTPEPFENKPDLPIKKWSRLSEDGRFKIFTFPDEYSLGILRYGPADRFKIEARGTVTVPSSEKLMFVPSTLFLTHPQFIRNFGESDLAYIDFKYTGISSEGDDKFKITSKVEMTDDELFYCHHLTGLTGLGLKNCRVTDKGLSYIKDLPLRQLNVDGTEVTAEGLASLRSFKKLEFLRSCSLKDGDAIIKALAGSKEIRFLSVTMSDVSDDSLKYLPTMPNLLELSISYNPRITDKSLKYIKQLKNLRYIGIEEDNFTPRAALDTFKGMNLIRRPAVNPSQWSPELYRELEKTWPVRTK